MAYRITLILAIVLAFSASIFANRRFGGPSRPEAMPLWRCQRIVSMAPSITETLYALGLGDRVVGVTRFCEYPPEAKDKPKVGGFCDPNVEAIVALKPDLVIVLEDDEFLLAVLQKLGLETLVVSHKTVQGVIDSFRVIGRVCGKGAEGRRLAETYQDRIRSIQEKTEGLPKPRVLFALDRIIGRGHLIDVYVAGADDYFDQIIACAGGENAYQERRVRYPILSPEGIIWLNPDVIVDVVASPSWEKTDRNLIVADWNEVKQVSAVKNHRVIVLNQSYAYVPGPRSLQLIEELARLLHPELDWKEKEEVGTKK
jgi:iron complex transport system substrate-binding protein